MKNQQNIRLDQELYDKLQAIRQQYGIPVAESVRRAVRLYLSNINKKRQEPNSETSKE